MKKTAFILSFVGGATDTLGFSLLYQLFTAHVTGNFVLIGSSIAKEGESDLLLWAQLSVLPIFFITILITSILIPEKVTIRTARNFLSIQAILLLLFLVFGFYYDNEINNTTATLIAAPAVVAMALQNMYPKFLFTKLPFTTVMTGNVTKIAMDLGALLKSKKSDQPQKLMSLQVFAAIGFVSGALIIALAANHLKFISAIIPALLILFLALTVKKEHL
ncbi:MAG: DUF1275 domain-containing protein [Bizionia sp.]|nr:DUF1275 domain-containing protein [Bizionia sp.]